MSFIFHKWVNSLYGEAASCLEMMLCGVLVWELIDWLGFNAVFNNFSVISRRPVHLLMCFLVYSHQYSTQQSSQATGYFSTLAHRWKTNDACRNDFCQTSERKLAEPGFKLWCEKVRKYMGRWYDWKFFENSVKPQSINQSSIYIWEKMNWYWQVTHVFLSVILW